MNDDLIIGCHVGLSAPAYFLSSAEFALSLKANAFMFYTGAPQNSVRKSLDEMHIEEGKAFLKEKGIPLSNLVVHAPYIINLANKENPENYEFAKAFLKEEIRRTASFGVPTLVLHPGARKEASFEEGAQNLADALNEILEEENNVKIALETMAGKGSEIGRSFEELAYILSLVKKKEKVGICLDTCHIFDAGYDIEDIDKTLGEFDRIIGLSKILVAHLNDSKTFKGSHKDRHENLGYGAIGFETLLKYAFDERLKSVPKILETPYVNGLPPYKKEIEMLRNREYQENWREEIS